MANPLQQCPWSSFRPATVSFCEDQLCAWIVKPAETWSNLGYMAFGLYILFLARKENNQHLNYLGMIGIILGIGSSIFHATGTFFGEFLDVSGMFLYVALGLAIGARRWRGVPIKNMKWIFLGCQGISMLLLWFIKPIGIALFSLQFTIIMSLEIKLYKKDGPKYNYRPYFYFVCVFTLAWFIWWMDILKIWCDPSNHWFNGHVVWHLLTSTSFYFFYQFLKQIPELRPEKRS